MATKSPTLLTKITRSLSKKLSPTQSTAASSASLVSANTTSAAVTATVPAASISTTVPTTEAVANKLNVDVEEKVYRNPASTVDALVVRKNTVSSLYELLVIQRGRNPYKGFWALPGGFVEYGEDPEDAVRRELKEETYLDPVTSDNIHLIAVRGKGDRDPRQHIITIAYAVKVHPNSLAACAGGDDAKDAQWIPLDKAGEETYPLAFDHVHIVNSYRAWFKKEGEPRGFYVTDNDPKQPGELAAAKI